MRRNALALWIGGGVQIFEPTIKHATKANPNAVICTKTCRKELVDTTLEHVTRAKKCASICTKNTWK